MKSSLSFQLRQKNGVASGEAHHRITPLAIWRDIDLAVCRLAAAAVTGVQSIRIQHGRQVIPHLTVVADKPGDGSRRIVTAGTLVGSQKLLSSRGLALGNNMVKRFGHHAMRFARSLLLRKYQRTLRRRQRSARG